MTTELGEKERGVNSEIVDRLLPSKRTAALLTQGAENQMPKRFKKSNAAKSSPSAEEPNVESSAANPSPSVRRAPVLHDFFVR